MTPIEPEESSCNELPKSKYDEQNLFHATLQTAPKHQKQQVHTLSRSTFLPSLLKSYRGEI